MPASDTSLVARIDNLVAQTHGRLFTPDRLLQLAERSLVRMIGGFGLDTSDTAQMVDAPDDEEDASRKSYEYTSRTAANAAKRARRSL